MTQRRERSDDGEPKKPSPAVLITFITGNKGKLTEVEAILKAGGANVDMDHREIDLPELQGDPIGIAIEKARSAFKLNGGRPVLVEDTSLCFNALGNGNLPGPYIRDFLKHLQHDGLNKILAGFEDKSAFAQCIFALAKGESKNDVALFVGQCHGHIVPQRGELGFGWDPIFQPTEGGTLGSPAGSKTFAEMSKENKNLISHRRRALDKLIAHLSQS